MKTAMLIVVIQLFGLCINAQTHVSGVIKDEFSKEVIPFVNIGFFEKNFGAISQENGRFKLNIPEEFINDTLYFSSIGYELKKVPVNNLKDGDIVYLSRKTYVLNPVTIRPQSIKEEIKGRTSDEGITLIFEPSHKVSLSGAEIGRSFSNRRKISINRISFYLAQNGYDTLKIRINVYNQNKTRTEDRLPFNNNIITITNRETGWFTTYIEPGVLTLDSDYIVTLELVDVRPAIGRFALKAMVGVPFSRNAYARSASIGKWQRNSFNLSIYTTVVRLF